jgi:UDPglucose 6-dehydrogenase
VWGLAFKPNTDDMREATSQVVIPGLLARGATVTAYDPVATAQAKKAFADAKGLRYAASPLETLDAADCLLIVTEWKEFRSPDFSEIKRCLKSPVIIDGRNLYEPAFVRGLGIEYSGIGR